MGRNSSTAGNEALVPVRDVKITFQPDPTAEYSFFYQTYEKPYCLGSVDIRESISFESGKEIQFIKISQIQGNLI